MAGALTGHRDWLGRRHLGLTIGLLTAAHLDTAELKAVLAHEAGHLTDTSRLRLRLCARRRHASTKLKRRGSRLLWWYWNWFLKVTRQPALESERHADQVAVSMYGAQLAARAHHRRERRNDDRLAAVFGAEQVGAVGHIEGAVAIGDQGEARGTFHFMGQEE